MLYVNNIIRKKIPYLEFISDIPVIYLFFNFYSVSLEINHVFSEFLNPVTPTTEVKLLILASPLKFHYVEFDIEFLTYISS